VRSDARLSTERTSSVPFCRVDVCPAVTCAETLSRLRPDSNITIITAAPVLKGVQNVRKIAKVLEDFDVVEKSAASASSDIGRNVRVVLGAVKSVNTEQKVVHVTTGEQVPYTRLCVCTGARPKLVHKSPNVIGIRDTETIENLRKRLATAKRVLIVGNGGVALELIDSINWCEVVWAIKQSYVGNTFFDADAARFFLPHLFDDDRTRPPLQSKDDQSQSKGDQSQLQDDRTQSKGDQQSQSKDDQSQLKGDRSLSKSDRSLSKSDQSQQLQDEQSQQLEDEQSHSKGDQSREQPLYAPPQEVEQPLKPKHDQSQSPKGQTPSEDQSKPSLRPKELHSTDDRLGAEIGQQTQAFASAIGPGWSEGLRKTVAGQCEGMTHAFKKKRDMLKIEFCCEVDHIWDRAMDECIPVQAECNDGVDWSCYVRLTNGHVYGCDFVVSATGVIPNTDFLGKEFARSTDGGLLVDNQLMTNVSDVYAAGDSCTVDFPTSSHWFQMRLWSQAKMMGQYMAYSLADRSDDLDLGLHFEIFAHVTHFFGYKVILLGAYNGQGLGDGFTSLKRVEEGKEYVKVVLLDGRVQGVILIGETDLEVLFLSTTPCHHHPQTHRKGEV